MMSIDGERDWSDMCYEESFLPNGATFECEEVPYTLSFSEKVELEQKRLAYTTSLVQAGFWKPNGKPVVKLTELEMPHLLNIITFVSKKNYYSSYIQVSQLLNPLLEELKLREAMHEST